MRLRLFVLAACGLAVLGLSGFRPHGSRPAPDTPPARPPDAKRRALPPPRTGRPPQLVVVSFDGSGGARLWGYWRSVARQAHAHFTFFVSGVYLVDWAHRMRYHPPRHAPGSSDIGFGFPGGELDPAGTLRQIAAAYREGHEIGTHYNGHFCAPYRGNVGEWTAADWSREVDQFDRLLFHGHALPFGAAEVVGGRTPCLQGDLRVLYPVLARHGFRYDASRSAPLGTWPWRERGIWAVPLPEIPLAGHTFDAISMDYNFLANQVGESPAQVEDETYRSIWNAFETSYGGNRAPFAFANHFETWDHWAYDHALARFVVRACALPEVRCVSYRELVDWLDVNRR
ncbi:MAG: hypothetical protein E6G22_02060 [Actinobacteria bacterium]|nr:MAG: hypothetical protein E6G22_02060 [Actinomycetota bacterium]